MREKIFIFMDSGDTIIDEGSEIRDESGTVIHAELIPGAREMMTKLYDEGYSIALVADGEEVSFKNVYEENGLEYCFCSKTISEVVGVQKPDTRMFQDAMNKNNLTCMDKKRIVMLGNNIKKDVAGANRFGIRSVLFDWSPRYEKNPSSTVEQPDFIIHSLKEFFEVLKILEEELNRDTDICEWDNKYSDEMAE